MAERRDYSAADITVVSLRKAVLRRPKMYSDSLAAADRPLAILAWTVLDLLDLAPAQNPMPTPQFAPTGRSTHPYDMGR